MLAAAAAGGWFAWRHWHGHNGATSSKGPAVVCVTPTPSPQPAPIKSVKVAVLNGTSAVGLAHTVAGQLTLRGFSIVKVGNGSPSTGRPRVAYAPGDAAAATTLAEQVPGAELIEVSTQTAGVVELDISTGFHRLATPAEVSAARSRDLAAAAPSPAVCSTPRG